MAKKLRGVESIEEPVITFKCPEFSVTNIEEVTCTSLFKAYIAREFEYAGHEECFKAIDFGQGFFYSEEGHMWREKKGLSDVEHFRDLRPVDKNLLMTQIHTILRKMVAAGIIARKDADSERSKYVYYLVE